MPCGSVSKRLEGISLFEKRNHSFRFPLCFQGDAIALGACRGWKGRVVGEQVQVEILCSETWKCCSK